MNHGSAYAATMVQSLAPRISTMVEYKDRLQKAMDDAKVSTQKLADHLKVSYQAVKKVLDGRSNSFTAANNDKAAKFLGVSPSWLATGKSPKHPHDAGLVVAEPTPDARIHALSARALSLAERLDALTNVQHADAVYAQAVTLLNLFEAEQRALERQEAGHKPAEAPVARARRRQADPAH